MDLRRLVAMSIGALGLSALLFAGTQVAGSTDAVEAQTPARVTIENFAYSPNPIRVRVGDTVTWTNRDTVPHTATAKDGGFNTGTIEAGESGSATFSRAGSWEYTCDFHPRMMGTLVVEAAAAPPAAPTAPAAPPAPQPAAPAAPARPTAAPPAAPARPPAAPPAAAPGGKAGTAPAQVPAQRPAALPRTGDALPLGALAASATTLLGAGLWFRRRIA